MRPDQRQGGCSKRNCEAILAELNAGKIMLMASTLGKKYPMRNKCKLQKSYEVWKKC